MGGRRELTILETLEWERLDDRMWRCKRSVERAEKLMGTAPSDSSCGWISVKQELERARSISGKRAEECQKIVERYEAETAALRTVEAQQRYPVWREYPLARQGGWSDPYPRR